MVQSLLFGLFPLGVAYGAAADVVSMTIPNRLVLALLAGFIWHRAPSCSQSP